MSAGQVRTNATEMLKDTCLLESAERERRMGFRRYEEYRDSSVEWLGKIPIDWQVSLIKRRYEVTLGKMLKSRRTEPNETEESYLRAANIHWRDVDTTDVKRMWFTAEEKRKLRLCKGDLLVSEGGDVGRSALWNDEIADCYIQNSINRIRVRKYADTRFLFYWMYFIKHVDYIDTICNKATIAHFTVEKVEATPCIYPPLKDQTAIVIYLDKETAKIDSLVAKQEQLIELLREKRQAVISHAVTKGLNPKVKMKDSGVEWLGEVPAEWTVKKLKNLCSQSALYGANIASSRYEEEGVRFLRTTDISDDGVLKNGGVFVHANLIEDYMLNDGDLLISRSGTVGRSFLYKSQHHGPCAYAGYLVRFVPSSNVSPEYLFLFTKTQAFQKFLQVMAISSTIENVNGEKYANAPFCIPPLSEQIAIAAFIERETAKIDSLIERCETAIELLKERRIALISAAVTGKIDVRDKV